MADEKGQGKSPWYTHRLMHRKRVTSELHDSYFRLMTIKHAIPTIEWAIEWAIVLLYNSVWTGSQWVGDQTSWRWDELETRCGRESHHPAEGAFGTLDGVWSRWWSPHTTVGLRPSGWAAVQENENDTRLCPEGLVRSICCSLCSVSNSLSHAILTIKWEAYFFKEVFAHLYSLRQYVLYICIMCLYS